jgi:hypothetical protein
MKMKKKAGAKAAKKATASKTPPAKPAVSKKAPVKPAAPPSTPTVVAEAKKRPGTYTPSSVQGTGWAPFRYPPQ